MKIIFQSLRALLVFTFLAGVLYPLSVTGLARLAFPKQASGSLVLHGDILAGSELLAQKFATTRYFWPRPSGADYATVASGASNKGPTSEDLRQAVEERRQKFGAGAPADLLTASGSGLDPHLSPAAAHWQAARVAEARHLPVEQVAALIDHLTEGPQFGFLGDPRVNVLALNLALDYPPEVPPEAPKPKNWPTR